MPRRFVLAGVMLFMSIGAVLACGSFATNNDATSDGGAGDGSNGESGLADGGTPDASSNDEDAGPPVGCPEKGKFTDQAFEIPPPTGLGLKNFDSARLVNNRLYISGEPTDGGSGNEKLFSFVLAASTLNTDLKAFSQVNWTEEDHHPFVFDSEKAVIFESKKNNPSSGGRDRLNLMRRAAAGDPFSVGSVERVGVDTSFDDLEEPWIVELPNRRIIFFGLTEGSTKDRIWSGTFDLAAGAIVNAKPHPELVTKIIGSSSATEVGHPVVTSDLRKIYFSALMDGKRKIYSATRSSPNAEWEAPSLVTELDDDANQHPTWISPNDCKILFIRDSTLRHAKRAAN